ncbi:MAG: AbgT family transporter [Cyanobacteria bacterium J06642_3]
MKSTQQVNPLNKFLAWVEAIGNKLPDPITLFFILAIITIILSAIASGLNLSVTHPGTGETINAVSLLTPASIRQIVTEAVANFVNYPPLGTVLVAMLGVGVAESSGLLSALLRKSVLSAPAGIITPVIVFAGIMSNLASDAGYVVLTPLGALVFLAFGRHPLVGLAAAFAGVSGGFSANLIVSSLEPLLAGITEGAAQLIDPSATVNPLANYYFMAASTILITLIGWYITDRIVEPRLGRYTGEQNLEANSLSSSESKGLKWAGLALLAGVTFFLVMVLPAQGILRDPENFTIVPSPFFQGIVPITMVLFLFPSIVYGKVTGSIRNDKDVAAALAESMSSMGYYIALAFITAQFLAYFKWSNLGIILAIQGANFLQSTGFTGLPLLVTFILVSAFINLFIGSASAKWNLIAPVFVPMLMLVGYSPEFTQLAYRIGDSTTNIITPLMPYFPVVVAMGCKYDKNLGIGTFISMMLPYSIAFLIGWTIFFMIWFSLGIPLGPGASVYL